MSNKALQGKNIIVGLTGGIAAYKAAILVRLLIKKGARVQVLMTPVAKQFITSLTLATLSKRPVLTEFFNPENGDWNSHVDLGLWADAMIVAPATANTLSKMAHGIADNLLLTTYLSAKCPVFFAPAMDLDMYKHPATLKSLEILRSYGNHIIEAESGELASGLKGKGRMQEPDILVASMADFFEKQQRLSGKTFLVTAGPTYEAIDSVRFIGNYSSGKMGYAIAEELANQGGKVILVSGPTHQKLNHPNIEKTDVVSAREMYEACITKFPETNGAIMNAAVSDFTPVQTHTQKLKRKNKQQIHLELTPTKDIAAKLGELKSDKQFLVGFALETHQEEQHAKQKMLRKNFDMIVLNSLRDKGAGFNYDTNKITIIEKDNKSTKYELKPKKEVAVDIVNHIINLIEQK